MKPQKTVLVVGCGGHARFILSLVSNSYFEASGLIDLEDDVEDSEVIMGVPVVGCLSSISEQHQLGQRSVVLAIGDNFLRQKTFLDLGEMGFKFPNLIHSSSVIDPTAEIGVGNVIGPNVVIGAEVEIGNNNIINSGAVIEHQSIIGDHNHVSLSATICGKVSVGDRVFLGANSVVIDNLQVADDTTLGAGGTLISSANELGLTLVGCPAKEIKK
jgi:sugar O-acyltransferase (sialic acid O-acetyltransferase NeuD family)